MKQNIGIMEPKLVQIPGGEEEGGVTAQTMISRVPDTNFHSNESIEFPGLNHWSFKNSSM